MSRHVKDPFDSNEDLAIFPSLLHHETEEQERLRKEKEEYEGLLNETSSTLKQVEFAANKDNPDTVSDIFDSNEDMVADPFNQPIEPLDEEGYQNRQQEVILPTTSQDTESLLEDAEYALINEDENTNQLSELQDIHNQLTDAGSVTRETVLGMEQLYPGIMGEKFNPNTFTAFPSTNGYTVTMESIGSKIKKVMLAILDKIMGVLRWIGNFIKECFSSAGDKLTHTDGKLLLDKRTELLEKAKGVDSKFGSKAYEQIKASDETSASNIHGYVFETLNLMTAKEVPAKFTMTFKYIVNNTLDTHVKSIITLIESEIEQLAKDVDTLISTKVESWANVEIKQDVNPLKKVASFWGNSAKSLDAYSTILDAMKTDMKNASKTQATDAPHEFVKAATYADPFTSQAKDIVNVSRSTDALVKKVDVLKKKVAKDIPDDSNIKGNNKVSIISTKLTYIQNLTTTMTGIRTYYARWYVNLNMMLFKVGNKVKGLDMSGKSEAFVKQMRD